MSGRTQEWISRPDVRVVQVIEVHFLRGLGTENSPVRSITGYYDFDGNMLAERDPSHKPLPNREQVAS